MNRGGFAAIIAAVLFLLAHAMTSVSFSYGDVPAAHAKRGLDVAVQVSPTSSTASGSTRLVFTVKVRNSSAASVSVRVRLPASWAPPHTSGATVAGTLSSAAPLVADGQAIVATGKLRHRGATIRIAYGGGSSGETEPTSAGTDTVLVVVMLRGRRGRIVKVVDDSRVITLRAPQARCQGGSIGPMGPPKLGLANGISQPDLFNVLSAEGTATQCFGVSGLRTQIYLADVMARQTTGVLGFPEMGFGFDLSDRPFCAGSLKSCVTGPFPIGLASMARPEFNYTIAETADAPVSNGPRDLIYDLWIEHDPQYGTGGCSRTTAPVGCPSSADTEVEIVLFHSGIDEHNCNSVSTGLTTPARNAGKHRTISWVACLHPNAGGTEAPIVLFEPRRPLDPGAISTTLALRPFLDIAMRLRGVQNQVSQYKLMGLEFGAEFGQCQGTGCQTSMSWSASSLSMKSQYGTFTIL